MAIAWQQSMLHVTTPQLGCDLSDINSFPVMQKGMVDTQLIAHDKEVYDIAWGGVGVFASVSADGSVRVFDLRYTITPDTALQYK